MDLDVKTASKRDRILMLWLMLWSLAVTVMRALRWPNDWAEAHWLISYDFGFVKRGLPGTLLSLFGGDGSAWAIQIISSVLLVLFFLLLFWLCWRVIRSTEWGIEGLLVGLLLLTSPYVVMASHLNGYFDHMIIMVSVMACLLVAKNQILLSALSIAIGVLIHETLFLVGFPNVVFFAMLLHARQTNASGAGRFFLNFIIRYKSLLMIPMAVFLCLVFYQSFFLDATVIKSQLIAHMSGFDFIERGRNTIVPTAFTHSFVDYLLDQGPNVINRITNPIYLTQIGIPLSVMGYYGFYKLHNIGSRSMLYVVFSAVILSPLLLHLIAWDTSRIWTYPLITTFLGIWSITQIHPQKSVKTEDSLSFVVLVLAVLVFQFFISTPLMDGAYERFSDAVRCLLYAPTLILLAFIISTNYRLTKVSV